MELSYDTLTLMFQARDFHIASISAGNAEEREHYRRLAEKCEARIGQAGPRYWQSDSRPTKTALPGIPPRQWR